MLKELLYILYKLYIPDMSTRGCCCWICWKSCCISCKLYIPDMSTRGCCCWICWKRCCISCINCIYLICLLGGVAVEYVERAVVYPVNCIYLICLLGGVVVEYVESAELYILYKLYIPDMSTKWCCCCCWICWKRCWISTGLLFRMLSVKYYKINGLFRQYNTRMLLIKTKKKYIWISEIHYTLY